MRAAASLRSRAIKLLAQREHSRQELRQKLRRHSDDEDDIETVLDWTVEHGFQCDERFARSLVHRREGWGAKRLGVEFAHHRLSDDIAKEHTPSFEQQVDSAQRLFNKRFQASDDPKQNAKQAQFLLRRGFTGEVVSKVLRSAQKGNI